MSEQTGNASISELHRQYGEPETSAHPDSQILMERSAGTWVIDDPGQGCGSCTDTSRQNELIRILNAMWSTIPPHQLPNYADFNFIVQADPLAAQQVESHNGAIGLTDSSQFSTISIIATITRVLLGMDYSLAAQLDDRDRISGWRWYTKPKA